MARPPPRLILLALGVLLTLFVLYSNAGYHRMPRLNSNPLSTTVDDLAHVSPEIQKGDAIMAHLGNETIKADLGRAAWKLFHTTMARFPDQPTEEESLALKSYMYLFARLYPCGECASHFQQVLKKFPPQTSSRSAAAAWGCHVHNEVNKSKGKPIFDCANIGKFYDCGCGDDEGENSSKIAGNVQMGSASTSGSVQDSKDSDHDHARPIQIAKEGLTNGG